MFQHPELQGIGETPAQRQARREAFEELQQLDLTAFWLWEERQINQMLHRLFVRVRIVLRDGALIGLILNKR